MKYILICLSILAMLVAGTFYFGAKHTDSQDYFQNVDQTDSFDQADILVQEISSVQGTELVTTLYESGRLTWVGGLTSISDEGNLGADKLQEVKTIMSSPAVKDIQTFKPEPNVLYEGWYSITLQIDSKLYSHTATNAELKAIAEIIREVRGF